MYESVQLFMGEWVIFHFKILKTVYIVNMKTKRAYFGT